MKHEAIPISQPDLSGNEEAYVVEAVRSSWISSKGQFVTRFEEEFAQICDAQHALSVCNGTVALHLALLALDVRPGDEVLVPALTYVATANAVRYVGAEPVFVDVDPNTWCIDPKVLEQSITRRTKGIIAVHLYGHPADMDEINRIAAVHGLWVVEDAAEAHYAKYKGRAVGMLGRVGTFSFYGNKTITCGEGGAVVVSDPQLNLRLRTLRGQGMDPARRYYHPVTGYNFRLTNVACAILCAQLERAERMLEERRRVLEWYRERLKDAEYVSLQPVAVWAQLSPWLMCVEVWGAGQRDEAARRLAKAGIETRPFFVPLYELPPFRESPRGQMEVTLDLALRGLSLPTFPGLTESQVDRICDVLLSYR